MIPPKGIIVGTGRSGSGYVAEVLNRSGVKCGHESWTNPWGECVSGLDVDSSWCALSLGLCAYEGHVLHQIRHPLAVVASFVGQPPGGAYWALKALHLERWGIVAPDTNVEFGIEWWVRYNDEAAERAEWSWRVEDVDADLICRIAALVEVPVERDAVEAAVRDVSHEHNRHVSLTLGWGDVEEVTPAGAKRLREAAERWSYE